jgi:hypothetical protein
MNADQTCRKSSWDGRRSYPCGRPVKEDGLCAQHLAGARRREQNDLRRREAFEDSKRLRDEYAARLRAVGVEATLVTDQHFMPTGYVTLPLAELERLVAAWRGES